MSARGRFVHRIIVALPLTILSACKPPTPTTTNTSTCDCSTFPPKEGCDAQCGITTGIVESVRGDSVVIKVPSVKTTADGGESSSISERTFSVSGAEANQLKSIAPGSQVALTFSKESGQSVVKSIRKIPLEPVK